MRLKWGRSSNYIYWAPIRLNTVFALPFTLILMAIKLTHFILEETEEERSKMVHAAIWGQDLVQELWSQDTVHSTTQCLWATALFLGQHPRRACKGFLSPPGSTILFETLKYFQVLKPCEKGWQGMDLFPLMVWSLAIPQCD